MRDRRGTGRLRESGWRASKTRGDPDSGDWPPDRSAAGQPGRPGASAVDMVAAMGPELGGLRSQPPLRSGRLRSPRRRPLHARRSLPDRRRVRRLPARADGRLQPAGVAHIEQMYRQIAQRCVARNGSAFLENVGTASAARDMDVVRQALGDDQINYLGYSYGTELGTAYVERFGDHVRAMVLDGAIDPSAGPIDELINQEAGFQTAFNDYAADCARSHRLPAGHRPESVVRPLPPIDRPAGDHARADLGGARARLRRRDHGHHQRAVHPAVLEIPDQRPARSAPWRRSR